MEEIRIYYSPWRMLLLTLGCLGFVVLSILILNHPKNDFHDQPKSKEDSYQLFRCGII